MNATEIEGYISQLGDSYEALLAEGVIPPMPLQELYEGRDWLDIEPESGVELSFSADSKRLTKVFITLLKSTPLTVEYQGELPEPFSKHMTQEEVRSRYGSPIEFKGPVKMPKPMGQTGGWDAYRTTVAGRDNTRLVFQYTADLRVKTLVFTV